jgi:hypothetical protein
VISDAEIERVTTASAKYKRVLLDARYLPQSDQLELTTSFGKVLVDHRRIGELQDVRPQDLETITVSPVALHVESGDIDIDAASLLADIEDQLTLTRQNIMSSNEQPSNLARSYPRYIYVLSAVVLFGTLVSLLVGFAMPGPVGIAVPIFFGLWWLLYRTIRKYDERRTA